MRLSMSTARAAGLLYLALGMLGAFSIAYLPAAIHVPGDPLATYENAVQSEVMLRMSIASGLLHKVLLLCLALLFVELFGRSHVLSSGAMISFVGISVPIYFVVMRDLYVSLPLLMEGGDSLGAGASAFTTYVEAYLTGMELVSVFWGLWLLPLGYLIFETRRVPRIFGAFLVAGGIGYLLNFFGPLLVPTVYTSASFSILMATISALGEIGLALWLLVFGVRPSATPAQRAAFHASTG